MAKKDKKTTPVDFHTGIGEIIPSTQEAYQDNSFSKSVRKWKSVYHRILHMLLSKN